MPSHPPAALIRMPSNFELLKFPDADALARAAAAAWLDEIAADRRAGRPHCVALSGGRIAEKFFAVTAAQAAARHADFAHVEFFWADERCVPPTDPESNFKIAHELLLAPLKIAAEKIHRLRGEYSPKVAVDIADRELCQIAARNKQQQPVLDLIVLGMGEDGHVASLFPNRVAKNLDNAVSFLAVENSPKPPPNRISLSYAAIFAAKNIWVLISGSGKAAALRESLSATGKTPLAQVIGSHPVKIFSDINEF
jgi:6-phosphogluconolactonase